MYGYRLGVRKSYLQRTTTNGLISCAAGLVSLRAGNKRQRVEDISSTEMESLQTSSPRGVVLENVFCGNSVNLI